MLGCCLAFGALVFYPSDPPDQNASRVCSDRIPPGHVPHRIPANLMNRAAATLAFEEPPAAGLVLRSPLARFSRAPRATLCRPGSPTCLVPPRDGPVLPRASCRPSSAQFSHALPKPAGSIARHQTGSPVRRRSRPRGRRSRPHHRPQGPGHRVRGGRVLSTRALDSRWFGPILRRGWRG